MTFYEHAMLGVTGTAAAGLHRRYGWQIVALGALTSVLPDWDGLSIVLGGAVFDQIHRTVGHSLLIAVCLGAAVAAADCRYRLADRTREFLGRRIRLFASREPPSEQGGFSHRRLIVWILVGVLASLGHLAVDLVYSGHETLSDWGLRLLWPFSGRVWAYPMVPWGDVGTTLIFVAGMFAMVGWRRRLQSIAALTLALVLGYIVLRG